jgi:hypothetical protein
MTFKEYLEKEKLYVFETRLDLSNKGLTDLIGIEEFIRLEYLDVRNNLLTSLDVSKNKQLACLYYSGNQIETLNISNNIYLALTPSTLENVELNQRWTELKSFIQNKKLEDGLRIEYYGEKLQWIDRPIEGVIKKDDIGFFILFDDSYYDIIRIDGSETCNTLLKYSGFTELD